MSSFGPKNLADDEDQSGSIVACAIATLLIAGFAVAGRFFTRTVIKKDRPASEDWFILIAWLLSIGYTVSIILGTKYGLGHHIWTATPEAMINYKKASWVNVLFYQLSIACSKISILLLYIRVLTYDYARRAAYILLAIVVIYNVLGFVSTMTLCIPLTKWWDSSVQGTCHPESFMWAAIGLHIGTDFLIFLLPMPVVLHMKSPLGQKIMLLLMFAIGLFVCLISILRLIWIRGLYSSTDFTWDYVTISNWTAIEVNTAILCACLIVMKPLIGKCWSKLLLSCGKRPKDREIERSRPMTIGSKPVHYDLDLYYSAGQAQKSHGSERQLIVDLERILMSEMDSGDAGVVEDITKPPKSYVRPQRGSKASRLISMSIPP